MLFLRGLAGGFFVTCVSRAVCLSVHCTFRFCLPLQVMHMSVRNTLLCQKHYLKVNPNFQVCCMWFQVIVLDTDITFATDIADLWKLFAVLTNEVSSVLVTICA